MWMECRSGSGVYAGSNFALLELEARAPHMQPPQQRKARTDPMAEPFGANGSGGSLHSGSQPDKQKPRRGGAVIAETRRVAPSR
jgi:hypothetical protein